MYFLLDFRPQPVELYCPVTRTEYNGLTYLIYNRPTRQWPPDDVTLTRMQDFLEKALERARKRSPAQEVYDKRKHLAGFQTIQIRVVGIQHLGGENIEV